MNDDLTRCRHSIVRDPSDQPRKGGRWLSTQDTGLYTATNDWAAVCTQYAIPKRKDHDTAGQRGGGHSVIYDYAEM